jgi:predicted nucleic acid-binding protein
MTLVVDASVAVKWLVEEPERFAARSLLDRNEQLHAPDFVFVETAIVLWKKVRRRELTAEQAVEGVGSLPLLFETVIPSSLLVARALRIAIEMAHPVCDCLYLACSEHLDADLVTADARFAAKVRAASPGARAHVLSEFGGAGR